MSDYQKIRNSQTPEEQPEQTVSEPWYRFGQSNQQLSEILGFGESAVDPHVTEQILVLDSKIAEMRTKAESLREYGESASDSTCGMPELLNDKDDWFDTLVKLVNNTDPVDPMDCAAGDMVRKKYTAQADALDVEADALEIQAQALRDRE